MLNINKKQTTFIIISAIIIVAILLVPVFNYNKIAYGITINDIKLGGKQKQEAEQILKQKKQQLFTQKINLIYKEKKWQADFNNLGFGIDEEKTVQKAYQTGKNSNFFKNLTNQILFLFKQKNIEPIITINQEEFQNQTKKLFKEFEQPVKNASLEFNPKTKGFSLILSQEGINIERKNLHSQLTKRIKKFSTYKIPLKIIIIQPEVKDNEVEEAKKQANRILNNEPYHLKIKNIWRNIDRETILKWIDFKPVKEENSDNKILNFSLDYEKVKKSLDEIATTIDRPVVNAQLKTENKKATVFIPPKEGYEVKRKETFNKFIDNLLNNPPIKTTEIIADIAYPKISLAETNNLGINKKIGSGKSNFYGSPKNRITNINIGVKKLKGIILNPNEEFSFINSIGDTGKDGGFLPELVIKKNKTIKEYGGGLCQISTTLFRAAVNSGLKITARTPHSYPVGYYNPQGFDATIYDPQPDLKFINNTPNHLLIDAQIDGYKLTFNFYGTDDKREVKIKGPYILESNPDGSMKAILYQKVYNKKGEKIIDDSFYSNYDSPDKYHTETTE